jgi:hypothetical protein
VAAAGVADTSTPRAAQAHARAQAAGGHAVTSQTVPASSATDLPPGVASAEVVWDETLADGGYAARRLRRGWRLRIEDRDATACVGLLLYNADNPVERLNVADVIKVQWNTYLGPGRLLLSDMGRTLASVLADGAAGHDVLCGTSARGRERLLLGLARYGLGAPDLAPNVNLFREVSVDADGTLVWTGARAAPGSAVELRCDMDVLVVLVNTPHVLDPTPEAGCGIVRLLATVGAPATVDDDVRNATPEGRRAFENTEDHIR